MNTILLLSSNQSILPSFVTGLFFLVLMFFGCSAVVIVLKFCTNYIRNFFRLFKEPEKEPTAIKLQEKPKKPRRKIRSIELDPEQVDRIIVRKP